jgi:hypothetical protein
MSLYRLADGLSSADIQGMSCPGRSALAQLPLPTADAGAALATAALGPVDIFGGQGMAMDARFLGCVHGGRATRSQLVFSGGHRSNMIDVDAPAGVTSEVVELHTVRNRSVGLHPNPSVTAPGFPSRGEFGVPLTIEPLGPEVASGYRVHLVTAPEPCPIVTDDEMDGQRVSVDIPAGVVLATPPLAVSVGGAGLDQAGGHDMTVSQSYKMHDGEAS